jgi:hypothetical protein
MVWCWSYICSSQGVCACLCLHYIRGETYSPSDADTAGVMQLWFFKLEHELRDSISLGLSPLIIAPRLPLEIYEVSTFENRIAGTGIDKDGNDAICTFTISPDATVEDCRVWRSVIEEDDIHGEPYSSAEEMLHQCACFCMISQHSLMLFSGYGYYLVRLSEDVDVPIAQIIWSSATESYFGADTTVLAPRIRHNTIFVSVFKGDDIDNIEIPLNHLPETSQIYQDQLSTSVDNHDTLLTCMTPVARWRLSSNSTDDTLVVHGSCLRPNMEGAEDVSQWIQVMSSRPISPDSKDSPFSVSIGRKAGQVEAGAILADEWTGKIALSAKLANDVSADLPRSSDGKTHILVINLLKQT